MSRVPLGEVRRFCIDCMTAVGTLPAHAVALADVLVEADRRGHFSHGINRLGMCSCIEDLYTLLKQR